MVVTLITWTCMLFLFATYGIALHSFLKRVGVYEKSSGYDILWFGIVLTTVYSQTFSIFYKVGRLAFILAVCLAILLLVILREEYGTIARRIIDRIIMDKKHSLYLMIVAFILVFFSILFTIRVPQHYDTYLYHAQNLKWIEEYGVVKGLGNFHNRFAYNSSFMCLQALFTFSWRLCQSLHTLNGFLWCFVTIYALCTLKLNRNRTIFLSDFLKILLLFYLFSKQTLELISSPHTDLMTMVLVAYIITRWVELLEEKETSYIPFGVLCLLGVFAVSVKLSAAMVLLLVLKPAVNLLRNKNWKAIFIFIGIGCIILLPFLIRNVLISGYLVYPYASIDLFNVEWKMPNSQVYFDNHEIIAWGRMLNDVSRYEEPISVWFPIWMEKNSTFNRVCMILNLALLPISFGKIIFLFIKKKYDDALVLACSVVLFLGWLLSAPLPRYGMIYMMLLPIYFIHMLVNKVLVLGGQVWKYAAYMFVAYICIGMMKYGLTNVSALVTDCMKYPYDYNNVYQTRSVQWNNTEVFLPEAGQDQVSYHIFPSTPYEQRLELIELRGDSLKDGFRIKEEFRDKKISTYGTFLE